MTQRGFLVCSLLLVGLLGCGDSGGTEAAPVADDEPSTTGDDPIDDTTDEPEPLKFCDGATRFLYDPVDGDELGAFPDDFYAKASDVTPTGLRVDFTDNNTAWVEDVPANFRQNVYQLNDLDGFGTTAGVFFRFNNPVGDWPSGYPKSLDVDAVRFVQIDEQGVATDVAFEVQYVDDGTTAVVIPMVPLRPKTRHGVVVTTAMKAMDKDCISPGPVMQSLLEGTATDPKLAPLIPRYVELLAATGLRADEVSVATVFTTQSVTDQALLVVDDIASRSWGWVGEGPKCEVKPDFRECTGHFEGADYRDGDGVFVDGTPQKTLKYPVSVWLPSEGEGPFPTVVFGHGIGGDRFQGALFAAELASQFGFALVAIDATAHGDHPAGSGGGGQLDVMQFFGINILTQQLDGLVLRDNWRQASFDKLQLVHVLMDAPDVTGDGAADIDLDRMTYLGVSLGGIMGGEFMALTDRIGAGVLDVCGGRLTSIITDSQQFGGLVTLAAAGASEGQVFRFFQLAQTLVERGDIANFAPHILSDRLPGTGDRIPQALLQIAIGDETIPNSASWYLTRAMHLPQLAPVVAPVDIVEQVTELPVAGNIADGAATAGMFQFDRVSYGPTGSPSASQHGSVPGSAQALLQSVHFLQTWFNDGVSEILDPYAELNTPPL